MSPGLQELLGKNTGGVYPFVFVSEKKRFQFQIRFDSDLKSSNCVKEIRLREGTHVGSPIGKTGNQTLYVSVCVVGWPVSSNSLRQEWERSLRWCWCSFF